MRPTNCEPKDREHERREMERARIAQQETQRLIEEATTMFVTDQHTAGNVITRVLRRKE